MLSLVNLSTSHPEIIPEKIIGRNFTKNKRPTLEGLFTMLVKSQVTNAKSKNLIVQIYMLDKANFLKNLSSLSLNNSE